MNAFVTPKWLHRCPFQLEGMALEMPELGEEHLNRLPFRGILTQVDEASTRPPNGSSGHRVLIPRDVAEQALPSLMGMPVDCSLGLKDHNKKTVIGVITGAEIQGCDLVVIGHLLAKNWPEEIAEIQRKKAQLGMSYEISNVHVEDINAEVWILTGLQFTGAAILYKHAAAYQHTAIAARAEEDEMSGKADEILTKLTMIDGTLKTMQAAKMDEDDEAAAKDEAEARQHEDNAARLDATAIQAREDADDEDAKQHEADAAQARETASALRLAAAKRHAEAAIKLRAATYEEEAAKTEAESAAQRHDEEAKRLKKMDEDCKEDAAAAKADADAVHTQAPSESDSDAQWEAMAKVVMAMVGKEPQEAAAKPAKKDPADQNLHMLGMLLRAMTYMPGMMEGAKPKPHDDKEQDVALIRELLRKGSDKPMAASSPVVSMEERRRLRRMEASIGLLTDQVSKLAGLMTDMVHSRRDLATDAARGPNGGPVRRSLDGTTEQWLGKYDNAETVAPRGDGKMTDAEISAALDKQGIRDPADRIARKVELQRAGKVAN